MEEYRKTEDRFFLMLYDYIGFLSALKINRAGLNSLSVKKFQFSEAKDKEFLHPIVKCKLYNTKNKDRIEDVLEPWFVDQYYPKLMKCNPDDYIYYALLIIIKKDQENKFGKNFDSNFSKKYKNFNLFLVLKILLTLKLLKFLLKKSLTE